MLRKHNNSTNAFNDTKNFVFTKNITLPSDIIIDVIGFTPAFNNYGKEMFDVFYFRELMDVVNTKG